MMSDVPTEFYLLLNVYLHDIREKAEPSAAEISKNKPSTLNTTVMSKGKWLYLMYSTF